MAKREPVEVPEELSAEDIRALVAWAKKHFPHLATARQREGRYPKLASYVYETLDYWGALPPESIRWTNWRRVIQRRIRLVETGQAGARSDRPQEAGPRASEGGHGFQRLGDLIELPLMNMGGIKSKNDLDSPIKTSRGAVGEDGG